MVHQLHGVRILTPGEYERLLEQVTKLSLRLLLQVMLFTGMRYEEVLRLKACMRMNEYRPVIEADISEKGLKSRFLNEVHFKNENKTITRSFLDECELWPVLFIDDNHIWIRSGKHEAKSPERNVSLTPAGIEAVKAFLSDDRLIYPPSNMLGLNLTKWSIAAGFDPLKPEQMTKQHGANTGKEKKNLYGMSVKVFRKTWENWLLTICPERVFDIMQSQGHDVSTSSKHYAGSVFSQEDVSKIREYVTGWKPKA